MKKVYISLLAVLFMSSTYSADFSLIRSIKNTIPLVAPGFLAGFLVQSKFKNPSMYAHAVVLPASMYLTNRFSKKYFKVSSESECVSDYKHSTETACTGAFFMYGLGLVTGSLWKAFWLNRA